MQHGECICAPPRPATISGGSVVTKDVHLTGLVMKDAYLPGLVTHVQKQLSKSDDLCSGPHSQEFFVNCPHPVPWGFKVVSKQLLALRKKNKEIKSIETEAVGLNPQGTSQVRFQTGPSPEREDRRKKQPLQISRINKHRIVSVFVYICSLVPLPCEIPWT